MKHIFQFIFLLILSIPIYIWGQSFGWDFSVLSLFLLFPILGMLAFSVMWTQTAVGCFSNYFSKYFNLDIFYAKSGLAVLILFLSHPAIAIIALLNTTGSANPFQLVSDSQGIFLILAMISFIIFLSFELTLRWKTNTLAKIKPWIENASYIGIILVWVHSLNIGSHTGSGWFHYLWLFYGISAIIMILKIFHNKLKK
jgi:hypothetical protein